MKESLSWHQEMYDIQIKYVKQETKRVEQEQERLNRLIEVTAIYGAQIKLAQSKGKKAFDKKTFGLGTKQC